MMETPNNLLGTYSQIAPSAQHTDQFRQLLATAITMRIQQLKAVGGPSIQNAQAITDHFDCVTSAPLYPLNRPTGVEGPTVRQTTEALAVLAFIPGGIYACGLYCQASATPPVVFCNTIL